jgi:hypothetical protein
MFIVDLEFSWNGKVLYIRLPAGNMFYIMNKIKQISQTHNLSEKHWERHKVGKIQPLKAGNVLGKTCIHVLFRPKLSFTHTTQQG